ncbi:hypothetical protein EXU57_08235 [Segetibacter sp. 3557_3]|uniref:hypothetical protein n=1 Tax=Segetibacter sp. 3557_3 TaxID=2547429 RepID=UPI001058E40D|nr:hypothetical protein [Segetibacter sp. 3557_3]TDH26790.1 hypothetical protein EXU57_08235 [Segetibacter sp. 3557_3]
MMNAAYDYFKSEGKSRYQEKMAEYSFLKDIHMQAAAKGKDLIVSRSDFDAFGFDVIIGIESKILFIQLKAFSGKAAVWDVHKSLLRSNNGHVVIGHLVNLNGGINVNYHMLKNENRISAYNRPPKVPKATKCKVNKGDLISINSNLLCLFDEIPANLLP